MNKASVDENFTGEEIKKMTPYFESFTNTRFSYRLLKEGSIPHRCMPTGAIPVGGPYDFICFDQMKNYPLKVKVWGYFDISDCKEVLVEEEFPERFRFWVSPILERKGHNLAARIITGKEKE